MLGGMVVYYGYKYISIQVYSDSVYSLHMPNFSATFGI